MVNVFMKKILTLYLLMLVVLLPSTNVSAERIYVKYRGEVNLDQFSCQRTVSSFVHRICYLEKKRYLVVLLKNTYYHYCYVPPDVVKSWHSEKSKGRYYIQNIKGSFDCREGGVPLN